MRISTSSLFDNGGSRLSDLQARAEQTIAQISAGTKMMSPADDPVAAARALAVQQSSSTNDQYTKNRLNLSNVQGVTDGTLSSMVDALQSIQSQVVGAGNGVLSDSDRTSIASALQGQYDQLLALANTTDGAGHYLFSGLQTSTPPYAANASGVMTYNGDANTQMVQVDTSRTMAITTPGSSLFPGGTAANVFANLQAAIADLKISGSTQTHTAALNLVGQSLSDTLTSIYTVQSRVGTNMAEIDKINTLGQDKQLQYAQTLKDLQDLDYNKALSDLSRQQTVLTAAQKSFQQISQLSLFNYIN
jgi:flagellar hook-associated protein 3 FlgL